MTNQRQFERINLEGKQISFQVDGESVVHTLIDISLGGLYFMSSTPYPAGTNMTISLGDFFDMDIQVVRVNPPEENGLYKIGAMFPDGPVGKEVLHDMLMLHGVNL